MHVQSVQNYCFSLQICDVLVTVVVVPPIVDKDRQKRRLRGFFELGDSMKLAGSKYS